MMLIERVAARYAAEKKSPEKKLTKRDLKDQEYQKSPEYKTQQNRDYYPQKAPPGWKLPSEVSSLGPELVKYVESMPDEDLDKNKAYSNRNVKAVVKKLLDRVKKGEAEDAIFAEFKEIDDIKHKMSNKYMDAKTDEEADKYRFAMRKLMQTWRAYNAFASSDERRKIRDKKIKDEQKQKKSAGKGHHSHEVEWDRSAQEWG